MSDPRAGHDRLRAWIAAELPALAPAWLVRQRWFGGKARVMDGASVMDVVWLPAEKPYALVVLAVNYRPGSQALQERYGLLVGVAERVAGPEAMGQMSAEPALWAFEATGDDQCVHALLKGLAGNVSLRGEGGGEVTYADATGNVRSMLAGGPLPIAPVGAEQSNTSVRVGTGHVFKLFRRLEEGENPQLEFGRFLATTPFRKAPSLEGSIEYRDADGRVGALGVLEDWVPNLGDGWSYVRAALQQAWRAPEAASSLIDNLFQLGEVTGEFHAAMASGVGVPAFSPEAVIPADVSCWCDSWQEQAERMFEMVERRQPEWPDAVSGLGRSVVAMREPAMRYLRSRRQQHAGFDQIRIHGDFHLGQTLKTAAGFMLIDFEGEPSRPLAERRRKQCALRDVAGMLRSLDYAVQTARDGVPNAMPASGLGTAMRTAFLDGYRARACTQPAPFLPAPAAEVDAWIRFFELQKAFFEVDYELNNRPSWVHIPLGAVQRLLAGLS